MLVVTCSNTCTDYFAFLNSLLETAGCKVKPVFALTEFEYRKGLRRKGIHRVFLRAEMYLIYPLKVLWTAVRASRQTVFVVTSNTFFTPILVAAVGKLKGFKTVHLVYDLFPDAIEVANNRINSPVARLLGRLTAATFRATDGTVYLGEFLREHAERRWGRPTGASEVMHIGVDVDLFEKYRLLPPPENKLWLHYGGQLGYMHDPAALISSLQALARRPNLPKALRINFYVSGAHAQRAKSELTGDSFEVLDAIPSDLWREKVQHFQVGLVSLSPPGATVSLPSKTYAMMAGGLAIIAICPAWSDLAALVLESGAGWIINNSPYQKLAAPRTDEYLAMTREARPVEDVQADFCALVEQLASRNDLVEKARRNARAAVAAQFSRDPLVAEWKKLLKKL
jgi:glycosyltransferase involved in cell wall biosynthesis